jgi:hypothetical protein
MLKGSYSGVAGKLTPGTKRLKIVCGGNHSSSKDQTHPFDTGDILKGFVQLLRIFIKRNHFIFNGFDFISGFLLF